MRKREAHDYMEKLRPKKKPKKSVSAIVAETVSAAKESSGED